ncbi:hypothetical protein [Aliterella atlantica]|uniref:Uncharacterized protein n=1 Tax=Aliterella atlantica CENA595 TaxID=1618023 RepID=A0A0D8ZN30_9CYAN|nr:hypothetical protein [Aliterella atlantica]KJH70203.1 hypothetical protein UH38_19620 [Aliterella atlantica CENA595]
MDFSANSGLAIAPDRVSDNLNAQVLLSVPQSDRVRTPQRRARYSDKQRIRLKDAKSWVLRRSGCSNTAEIKKYLKILGKKLDLRLTSAWIAIYKELAEAIRNLVLALGSDRLFEFVPLPVYLAEVVEQVEFASIQSKSAGAESLVDFPG